MKMHTLGLKKGSQINSMKFSFRLSVLSKSGKPNQGMTKSCIKPFLFVRLGGELGMAG